ncbi:MAG: ketoacyl-ACP synthase III [Thermoflexales bacterium]|nr:ketoacyl-ACP synthase III [Thermoflexales bacterium]
MAERRSVRYAHIAGWGMYVPPQVLTNDDLAKMVNTSDEWITSHTGIRQRHVVSSTKETTSTLATAAAREALERSGTDPSDVELIILATLSPDYIFPATACLVQDALGADRAGAFDLSAGCSGFIYALAMGSQAIASGAHDTVLIIGAETCSRLVDWTKRDTCVLFGDGAGAVVLRRSDEPGGVLSTLVRADGSGSDVLLVPAGGSRQPASRDTVDARLHYVHMNGPAVYKFATRIMAKAVREAIERAGLSINDIDLFIPHQANLRIIESAARQLGVPLDKFFLNLDRYGNTSAASVPIALCEAVEAGQVEAGDHIIMVGFGAGLTWAAAAIQWDGELAPPRPAWERAISPLRRRARRVRRRIEDMAFGNPILSRIEAKEPGQAKPEDTDE